MTAFLPSVQYSWCFVSIYVCLCFLQQTTSSLSASWVVSDGLIHVWSGNNDFNSQKSSEMLPAVRRWGTSGGFGYDYIIYSQSTSEHGMLTKKSSINNHDSKKLCHTNPDATYVTINRAWGFP